MRRVLRAINVLVAAVTLASGVAVLGSLLLEPGYHEAYGDSLVFAGAYVALQVVVVRTFWADSWLVPWLALGKALAAYAFLVGFVAIGPLWMARTPGRYVYQLFDWGRGAEIGLIAMVWLGRGAWNTLNALYFTAPWWQPLRRRRPLLGRLVTGAALAVTVACAWTAVELLRVGKVRDVADGVLQGLDCDAIRSHEGQTTVDVRAPKDGGSSYTVRITWSCQRTRVLVADPAGRIGVAEGARPDCCPTAS